MMFLWLRELVGFTVGLSRISRDRDVEEEDEKYFRSTMD